MQQWEMRKQIVIGKLSYPQTMIELGLRISYVRSMCLSFQFTNFSVIIELFLFCYAYWHWILVTHDFSRYEEKRWVSKGEKARSPPRVEQERRRSVERSGPGYEHGHSSNSVNLFEEKKTIQAPRTRNSIAATRISLPVPPQGPDQVPNILPRISVLLKKIHAFSYQLSWFPCHDLI